MSKVVLTYVFSRFLNRFSISRTLRVTYSLNTAAEQLANENRFNPKDRLIIYIHGFTDDPTLGPNFGPISNAYLETGAFWMNVESSHF